MDDEHPGSTAPSGGPAPEARPPKKNRAQWSTQRIVTLVILLAILAVVIYLKITGVV